jgi:hypothetical protein
MEEEFDIDTEADIDTDIGKDIYINKFLGKEIRVERYLSGERSLLYIVMELAITDCKALIEHGIIVNGECISKWPRENGKPKMLLGHYSRVEEVIDLLGFMKNKGISTVLSALGDSLDVDKVNIHLGLKK